MLQFLWKPKPESDDDLAPQGATCFTYHVKSGMRVLLCGFLLAAIVETIVLHVLLSFVNHWLALAATLTTVFFILQVIAQIRAVGMAPLYLHNGKLTLRNGAFDIAQVSIQDIERVELTSREIEIPDGHPKPLNVTFPAGHNVVVRFKTPLSATILNRKKRDFEIALLAIDNADRFKSVLEQEMAG